MDNAALSLFFGDLGCFQPSIQFKDETDYSLSGIKGTKTVLVRMDYFDWDSVKIIHL